MVFHIRSVSWRHRRRSKRTVKYTTDAITRSIIQESARKKEGKTVADKNVYEVVWPHNTLLKARKYKAKDREEEQPPHRQVKKVQVDQ
jgi:hypothetical protein